MFCLALILILGLEFWLFQQDSQLRLQRLKDTVRERLLSIGQTAVLSLDQKAHGEIFTYHDRELPEFQELKNYLERVRTANGIEEHLYTLRIADATKRIARFVVMTNPEPFIGTEYIYPAAMDLAFFQGIAQTTDIYQSRSLEAKSWISAFIPFKEPGEEHYAVLEVDLSVDNLLEQNRELSRRMVFFHILRAVVVFLLFAMVFYMHTSVLRSSLREMLQNPLLKVLSFLKSVGAGDLSVHSEIRSGDELETLSDALNEMVQGLKQKETMSRFLTGMELEEVLAVTSGGKALNFSGERARVAILFSDIRNFTTLCEDHHPEIIIESLNLYFSSMISAIEEQGGILDKLIGDAVMAVFEIKEGQVGPALRATRTAVAMQNKLQELRPLMVAKGWPEFHIGIGIHVGQVVVGNVGSQTSVSRTVLGDAVNLSARIEALSKQGKHSHILVSEDCLSELSGHMRSEFLLETIVKGKSVPVKVFEVVID